MLSNALARDIDLIVATGAFEGAGGEIGATDPSRLVMAEDWEQAYPLLRERLAGDEVVLLGTQGAEAITANEWGDRLDTIGYEVVCGIGPRVPRVHVEP